MSYSFTSSFFRSFVHGNFDAVALLNGQSLQMLGGRSVRLRTYNIQHSFDPPLSYQLAFVNPSESLCGLEICVKSTRNCAIATSSVMLPPRGTYIFDYSPSFSSLIS